MAHARHRNDSSPTVYHVTNALIGEPGEITLDKRQLSRLSLIIRQAARLFCVNVISFTVKPSGYSLVCSALAEPPSRDELREHFFNRYGTRREMPDFNDPDVYDRWAARLRDFSCLAKDIQQRFTQWYNHVVRKNKRRGTLWKSRFQSRMLKTARQAMVAVKKTVTRTRCPHRLIKLRGQGWRKTKRGVAFLRDRALPALTAAGSAGLLVTYVLLDELSRLPQTPFPIKLLRDILADRMEKNF
ncbi:MAG: hypothetical protein RRC34_09225 [Lentisphaeria bacterium]|nr:hypothetical protein [Lentisphaeria bacterium]